MTELLSNIPLSVHHAGDCCGAPRPDRTVIETIQSSVFSSITIAVVVLTITQKPKLTGPTWWGGHCNTLPPQSLSNSNTISKPDALLHTSEKMLESSRGACCVLNKMIWSWGECGLFLRPTRHVRFTSTIFCTSGYIPPNHARFVPLQFVKSLNHTDKIFSGSQSA